MATDFPIQYQNEAGSGQPQVVMFAENDGELFFPPIAWQVIEHLALGGWHKVKLTSQSVVSAKLPSGSVSTISVPDQAELELATSNGGTTLEQTGVAAVPQTIRIKNALSSPDPEASIELTLEKDGAAYMRMSIPAEEDATATFTIPRSISFALTTGAVAGEPLDMKSLQQVQTFEFGTLPSLDVRLVHEAGTVKFKALV
jgi:hypothetical protein